MEAIDELRLTCSPLLTVTLTAEEPLERRPVVGPLRRLREDLASSTSGGLGGLKATGGWQGEEEDRLHTGADTPAARRLKAFDFSCRMEWLGTFMESK